MRNSKFSRRKFVKTATLGTVTVGAASAVPSLHPREKASPGENQRIPLKVGHRAASMKMVGNFEVFKYHYDLYAQALAKVERSHSQDVSDVTK